MTKMMITAVAVAFCGSAAMAANLNVTVQSGGQNTVNVSAGATVDYVVTGELSDDLNEGLALVGFDLEFDGGDLEQATAPAGMSNFVMPEGITNPAGYGGTIIDGKLIQVGGGQNTIKNTESNAPFPIGAVVETGLAHPGSPLVLATGTLTVPTEPGEYHLSLTNLFANVIREGETGDVFWATEQANPGTNDGLQIFVVPGGEIPNLVSSSPANNAIDAGKTSSITPQGFASIALTFDGDPSALTAGDVTVASTSGAAPTITGIAIDGNTATLTLSGPIPAGAWTSFTIANTGTDSTRLGLLPADVNGDGTSTPTDILDLIDAINGVGLTLEEYQTDVNRSGLTEPSDILDVIDLLNGAGEFDAWNGVSLPS